jgi:sterol desaturase/sphingolipid hydroxylase (fatty acid hydroxylase superfamily)
MAATIAELAAAGWGLAERVPGFLIRNVIAEWHFYLMMAVALGIGAALDLSRRRKLGERYLSRGFRTDAVYAAIELSHVSHLIVLVPLANGLNDLFGATLPGAKLDLAVPVWAQVVILFVFGDFYVYWYHRALHTSRYLWQFHKVHHSQEQLSALSGFRISLLDRMLNIIVLAIPTFMLGGYAALPVAIVLVLQFHQLFQHIDLRWSFGPLRHVFVTPAFHVTHHSVAAHHANRNFGSVLTIWDRLFGTRAERGEGELRFGLTDERVPEGYLRQLFVPAIGVGAQLKADLARLVPAGERR